jgi:hypothetical protein
MSAEERNVSRETVIDFDGRFWEEGSLCEYGAQERS